MEDKINYREEIQKALTFIPDEYLEPIYKVIQLIAKPFIKEKEEKLNLEILQNYAYAFRKTFQHLMKKDLGINFIYAIETDKAILQVEFPTVEEQRSEILASEFDLENICQENKVKLTSKEEGAGFQISNLAEENPIKDEYSEKAIIFNYEKNSIYFIETLDIEKWKVEQAQEDARHLLGFLFLHIAGKKTKETIS